MRLDASIGQLKIRRDLARFFIYAFLIVYSLACLFPFLWSIMSSFKASDKILVYPFQVPTVWKWQNYREAWVTAKMALYFWNTAVYAILATGTLLVIAPMASYVIARVKKSNLLYLYYTLGIMIPVHTILLPSYIFVRQLHIVNTRLSIILIYIAFNLSMSIFILVGFMRSLPKELEEAALIDGCSRTRTFFDILYPLSKPGLATIGTLAFLNNWNDYLVPLIFLTNSKLKVITLGVQELRGLFLMDLGLITAGVVLSFLPVVVVYIVFQEQVIKGMTAGAVKG
jgi:raffinose/stachyose/melibiose transport system permease protein